MIRYYEEKDLCFDRIGKDINGEYEIKIDFKSSRFYYGRKIYQNGTVIAFMKPVYDEIISHDRIKFNKLTNEWEIDI